jgi:hypothetical protein
MVLLSGRLHLGRALGAALISLGAGFVAVLLAAAGDRPDLGAIVIASVSGPLWVITLFHALRDLGSEDRQPQHALQAWLALLVSLAPLLLLGVFLLRSNPEALGPLRGWLDKGR